MTPSRLRDAMRQGRVTEVLEALAATGALESTEDRARQLAANARRALAGLPATTYRTALEQIADWAVKRDR